MAKTNKIKILFCVQQKPEYNENEQWSAVAHMKLMCRRWTCGDGACALTIHLPYSHIVSIYSIYGCECSYVCVCVCALTETETDINSRWHELGRHAHPTLEPQTLLVTINLDASCSIWLNELMCRREPLVHLTLLRCPNASATSIKMDMRCDTCTHSHTTHQTTTC